MSRKLIVEVVGDTSRLDRSLKRARTETQGFAGAIGGLRIGFATLAKSVIFVEALDKAIEGLGHAFHAGTDEVKERIRLSAQIDAALKSTGDTANVTSQHIDDLALSLSNLSGVDDEVVKGGEAVLLAFTNIRNFAGKGNDIFDQATKAAVNYSVRSGRSMQTASIAIGRALQDPAKASTSLRRAQVVLTSAEKQGIAVALRHGQTLKAQQVILAALETRYGGAAKAAGQTLPGQLSILRERLKDVAGSILETVVPAFTTGVRAVVGFASKLSEIGGTRAKLRFVLEGAEQLGRDIAALFQKGASAAAARIRSVNWGAVIRAAARGLSDAIVKAADAIRQGISRIDWQQVGKYLVDGFLIAVAAVAVFLRNVRWGSVMRAMVELMIAALRAQSNLLLGVGKEIGRLLVKGVEAGLIAFGRAIERIGIEIALKFLEPFTHLPAKIAGIPTGIGSIQALKRSLQKMLRDAGSDATKTAQQQGQRIGSGILDGIITDARDRGPTVGKQIAGALPPPPTQRDPTMRGATASQRNAWFDAVVSRQLDRLQDLPLRGQLAKLRRIAELIRERIAVTKDITRKLNLEDQLLSVLRQVKSVREAIAQAALDALQLNVDRAGLTASVADDLKALRALEHAIEAQIASAGHTLALEQQLLSVQQQIAAVLQQQAEQRAAARKARQFRALGLTAEGDERAPGVRALRSYLGVISAAVKGTFLDTAANQSLFARIRRVLSGQLGAVGRDVRLKIQQILDQLNQELKNRTGDQTRFRHLSTRQIAAALGLDLSPSQMRALRAWLAGVGPGGSVPAGSSGAFAGAGAHRGVTIHGDVHVHGVRDPADFEDGLTRRANRRPQIRRGAR